MQIRRHIRVIGALLVSMSLSSVVSAMEKEEALAAMDKIFEATISSFYSINGFYNFSANQADQEQRQKVQFAVGTVEDLMIDISGLLSGSEYTSQVDGARDAWLQYEDSLNENIEIVDDSGYTDLRLVGELAGYNIAFNDTLTLLYRSIANDAGIAVETEKRAIHEAGKVVALIMTKYSARSTSTVSQVYAREDEADITLDALAGDFDKQLNQLIAQEQAAEASKLLDSAKTKWEFIRPSIINYNENRVNFIVNLYSRKIIEDLQNANAI